MGNLLGGAYVCWASASGNDITDGRIAAVWLAAMFFDVLDGWAARKLGVESPMGVQLDSLADLVTSGLAPAFVSYRLICESGACDSLMLNALPALLVVAAAYRLARYNVSASEGEGNGDGSIILQSHSGPIQRRSGRIYPIRVSLTLTCTGQTPSP